MMRFKKTNHWLLPTCALLLAATSTAQVSDEIAYVTSGGGGRLTTYDLVSLERGEIHDCGVKLPGVSSLYGLIYRNGRLYTIDRNHQNLEDRFIEVHPSNGDPTIVGYMGISPSNNWTLDFNPLDGELYGIVNYDQLYKIDIATGSLTFVGPLFGGGALHITGRAMAVDSTGQAVIAKDSIGNGGPGFDYLDLATGGLQPIGRLTVGLGRFKDLAFDSKDRLWGIYTDYFDPQKDGLYLIQLPALTFKKVLDEPQVGLFWQAIAFGPAPDVTEYCTSSASASGCTPSTDSEGLPSPTAPSGFEVRAHDVPSGAIGILAWGPGAATQVPFGGGTLCIEGPTSWSAVQDAGGNTPPGSDCSGTWSLDLNAELFARGAHAPGTTLRCQWLGRDSSASTPSSLVMSDALEFVLAP